MATSLENKVALITGAGSGIGRATALIFAREGARVVVSDVNESSGLETVAQIEKIGGEAIFSKADISIEADVEALVSHAVNTWGRIDCAFNNAGTEGAIKTTAECTEAEFNRTLRINLTGVWLCMKHEIRQMLTQGGGAIVNASSAAGLAGVASFPDYVASKHGVIGLTRTAALEYATQGIRVNAVCPGVIETPMVARESLKIPNIYDFALAVEPVGRMGTAAEVGEAVLWLCSDAASFVTGHPMAVDGGALAQ